MPPGKNIDGNRYGSLICVERHESTKKYQYLYLCICDCGNHTLVRRNDLISGKTKSCGCGQGKFTHGLSRIGGNKTKLYSVWSAMRDRCNNPRNKHFSRYGGRGIFICEAWGEYPPFYRWAISNGYKEGFTIERINNDFGYSPDNCTWVPQSKQPCNTCKVKYLTLNGETHSMREWSNLTGMNKQTIRGRLRMGWSIKDTLTRRVAV